MKIIRCLVMDCAVYTQFANGKVVKDQYDSPERAKEEQQVLLHLNVVLHGDERVA